MIFNTFSYFILFLVPAAILFRVVRAAAQKWVCIAFGGAFFVFFSLTQIGGVALHEMEPPHVSRHGRIGNYASWALTFVLVNLGWAFFCMDLKTALFFFRRLIFG
jgi:hypothetical protein